MRTLRGLGIVLIVLALVMAPFASDVTLGWGLLLYALGLLGVTLLLRAPRSAAKQSEDEYRKRRNIR